MSPIIFDFFGVVCSEIAPFWLRRHLDDATANKVKASIVHQADLGGISTGVLFERLGGLVGLPAATVYGEWLELAKIDQLVFDKITQLKQAGHRVALLTNAPSDFVRVVLSREDLEHLFDPIIVSSEVGLAKPDPAIYELICRTMNVDAADVIFVDDNPKNVIAATTAGMHAITYKSGADLDDLDRIAQQSVMPPRT